MTANTVTLTIGALPKREYVDLGDEHYAHYFADETGERAGVLIWNRANTPTGWCISGIAFRPLGNRPVWEIVSGTLDGGDLTVTPSIHCAACNDHGFIRQGRWVRA